jgi:hypothetical protein
MTVRPFSRFIVPLLFVPSLAIVALAIQPPKSPIGGTIISFRNQNATLGNVVATLSKTSGIPISVTPTESNTKCPVTFNAISFWSALEQTARQTGMKIVLIDKGTKVALEPRGMNREVSTVNGPFRIVAKQVIGRALLDLGVTFHEVYLEVNWEPRIHVFRIDTQPHITKIIADRSASPAAPSSIANGYPTDVISDMKFRVNGLTRESKQIDLLAGEFRVTAAEEMQSFIFEDLSVKLPITKEQSRVIAKIKKIAKPDKSWDVELELQYPEGHPPFESYEAQKWLRDNRLQLVTPDGKPFDPENEEIDVRGRRIEATYRFSGDLNPLAKGWRLIYETPSPLVEFKVPFELKNIPLP